ncbi:MAG: NAD-dependent epimerase/dehydratase family protein, partial [Planctomycetota bacterium]
MDTEKLRGLKPGATVAMTGGRGLVASRIRDRLAETYRLRLLDLYPADEPGLRVEAVDLTDFAATARSLDGVDGVIHLAIASQRALTHLDPHAYAEAEIRANVLGTRHLFEAAAEAGVKRVVYASSVTVHLGEPRTHATATGDPLRPL